MKKYFKFFSVAAIVAAGLVGCTSEVPVDSDKGGNTGPTAKGEYTYATFNFKLDNSVPTSKAPMIDDQNSGDATENVAFNSIRLIIFNSANLCEANEKYLSSAADWISKTSKTVRVVSGPKKIFVIANETSAIANILDGLVVDNPATSTVGTTYTAFLADAVNRYDLGGPGSHSTTPPIDSAYIAPTGVNAFEITKVIGTVTNPRAYILSNAATTLASEFTLVGSVSENDSRTATPGDATKNNIMINVKRMVAKGIVYYDNTISNILETTDGTGSIVAGSLKWGVDNVNRSAYLFQQYVGPVVKSPWYTSPSPISTSKVNYYPFFYKAYDRTATITAGYPTANPIYYYFTENTRDGAASVKGNLTYAAIETKFSVKGGFHFATVDYNSGLGQVNATLATTPTNDPATNPSGDFYKLIPSRATITATSTNPTGTGFTYNNTSATIPENAIFVNEELAYKTLFLTLNGHLTGHSNGWRPTDPKELAMVEKYTGGICYYRFNFGDGVSSQSTGAGIVHEVERNVQYQAKITGFTKLGVNKPEKLDDVPETPDATPTYVTATLSVVPWTTKTAAQPL